MAEIRKKAEAGQLRQALERLEPHLAEARPDPEAVHLAGLLRERLGQYGPAAKCFRRAVKLRPDDPRFNFRLGKALVKLGRFREALAALQKASWLHPGMAVARSHLGLAQEGLGNYQAAFDAHLEALELDPALETARRGLASLLGGRKLKLPPSPLLRRALEHVFASSQLDPQPLSRLAAAQIRRDHRLLEPLPKAAWQPPKTALADPLFLRFLSKTVNVDPLLEAYLAAGRAWFLNRHSDSGLQNNQAGFLAALGRQCFNNGYVFFAAEPEERLVQRLWQKAGSGRPATPAEYFGLAVCALYCPLHTLPGAQKLARLPLESWPLAFRGLIRQTLVEPCTEAAYQKRIPELGAISDEVSLRVAARYEQGPHPRWSQPPPVQPRELLADLAGLGAKVEDLAGAEKPQALVAGCGTGHQALGLALSHPELEITLLDLSRANLAYGMRQALELGLNQVKFLRGDLLEAGLLGESYHYIECLGVLHQLADPLTGLRELAARLTVGGLLKASLLGRGAGRKIAAARKLAARMGIGPGPAEIRKFRRDLLGARRSGSLGDLLELAEFYNLDELRDLLLPVREHCFDLPELRQALNQAGLRFMGFPGLSRAELDSFIKETGAEPDDLDAWEDYERKHPGRFKPTYVFLCQKTRT